MGLPTLLGLTCLLNEPGLFGALGLLNDPGLFDVPVLLGPIGLLAPPGLFGKVCLGGKLCCLLVDFLFKFNFGSFLRIGAPTSSGVLILLLKFLVLELFGFCSDLFTESSLPD